MPFAYIGRPQVYRVHRPQRGIGAIKCHGEPEFKQPPVGQWLEIADDTPGCRRSGKVLDTDVFTHQVNTQVGLMKGRIADMREIDAPPAHPSAG